MQRIFTCIFIALALITLTLSSTGCSLLLDQLPVATPSPIPQDNDPAEHVDANWIFPSDGSSEPNYLPDFPPVIARVMPSVVSVTTEMVVSNFFGQQYTQDAAGSGMIIDAEGYIVTNYHVVQAAKSIQVELHDGRTFSARIVGTDTLTDLAVLKVAAPDLCHIPWGDSSQLTLGNWVIAIGNALGEGISACEGIVSRMDVTVPVEGNTLRGLIQTTAAINPGNSGGPLVNMAGEVIGITSAKIASVGIEGMGYAISSNSAKPIVEDLIRQGYVTRPWLGVEIYSVTPFMAATNDLPVDEGALITSVLTPSPAAKAGLQEGDIVIRFGGENIATRDELVLAIHNCQIGEEVKIVFIRGIETKTALVQMQETPSPW